MKILVIALSGIGDALMFTPALQKLREELPSAEIDALVMYKGVKDIYTGLPQFSNVIYFDFVGRPVPESIKFVLSLRNKYDATISVYPSNRKEYNIINRMIGAEKRFAVRYLHNDFFNLGFLNTSRIMENNSLHNVEENVGMAEMLVSKNFESIPPLQINLSKNDLAYADDFLKNNLIDKKDLVVGFHPGCSPLKNHEKRRWAPDKFSGLAKKLIENFGAKILIFGGGDEQILKEQICAGTNSPDAIPVNTSNLTNTAAVMKRCCLFISNDSSLMHVAAALKLNVVAIIGPTNVNYIYPWQTNYEIASINLDCSPCFYYSPKPLSCSRKDLKFKCVKELSVDHVFELAANQIRKEYPR
ncbi:MAG: glycosyltransferase family 9 protein [Ignavibacteriae bacterium HGW-Ignavibacteriae-3]|nr:MAG: glycosyltransferase family 9 protein [Ignavibacteriae bacterium HGW-Ignavibacteriae-3]